MEPCQSPGCKNEARAAIYTPPSGRQHTLYTDDRDAINSATRYCKGHAVATISALASDLIDEDD